MMADDGVGIWMSSWEFSWLGFHLYLLLRFSSINALLAPIPVICRFFVATR